MLGEPFSRMRFRRRYRAAPSTTQTIATSRPRSRKDPRSSWGARENVRPTIRAAEPVLADRSTFTLRRIAECASRTFAAQRDDKRPVRFAFSSPSCAAWRHGIYESPVRLCGSPAYGSHALTSERLLRASPFPSEPTTVGGSRRELREPRMGSSGRPARSARRNSGHS